MMLSSPFSLVSVVGMVGPSLFCIGCAFRSFVWCCCTFVRNYHCRSGVEEGRLGNIPSRLPRFGAMLRRNRFGLGCGRWFRNRFMHGGGSLFFVVCGRGRILFRSQGANLSLIHISEPTRLGMISYAVFCLKKKK